MDPIKIPLDIPQLGQEEFLDTGGSMGGKTEIIWKLVLRASPQLGGDRQEQPAAREDLENFLEEFSAEHGQ